MDFGEALRALKAGLRVARAGWNGKGMFLLLPKRVSIPDESVVAGLILPVAPSICMKTAQDTIVIGWLASQADMLSEDWQIVETERMQGVDCYRCEDGEAHVHAMG